jgi:hypothetical protein
MSRGRRRRMKTQNSSVQQLNLIFYLSGKPSARPVWSGDVLNEPESLRKGSTKLHQETVLAPFEKTLGPLSLGHAQTGPQTNKINLNQTFRFLVETTDTFSPRTVIMCVLVFTSAYCRMPESFVRLPRPTTKRRMCGIKRNAEEKRRRLRDKRYVPTAARLAVKLD